MSSHQEKIATYGLADKYIARQTDKGNFMWPSICKGRKVCYNKTFYNKKSIIYLFIKNKLHHFDRYLTLQ